MITRINEFKKYLNESLGEDKSGIIIYPHRNDIEEIENRLEASEYYHEWNSRDGYFFIEEEYEEAFDGIMSDIDNNILLDLHYKMQKVTNNNNNFQESIMNDQEDSELSKELEDKLYIGDF